MIYKKGDIIMRDGKKVGRINEVEAVYSQIYFSVGGYNYDSCTCDIATALLGCKIMNTDEYTAWCSGFVQIKAKSDDNLYVYLKASAITSIESWGDNRYTIYAGERGYTTVLAGGLESLGLAWIGEE